MIVNEPLGAAHPKHGGRCCPTVSTERLSTVIDLICGMSVDPAKTAHHIAYGGNDYHFCSARCLAKFTADPAKYLSDAPRVEVIALPGAM